MNKSNISAILNTIYDSFDIKRSAEITIECNPDDISSDKIKFWKANNLNRVSLGIQSFNDSDLKLMNRSHSSEQALFSLDLVKQNFENFSLDLIYGIPNSSFDKWKKNLQILIENDIPHISTYALTVEPKTALKKLIGKNEVECSDEGNDKYGRTLSICYANGVDLQSEMVRSGMAVAYIRYSTRYENEMIEAMTNRAGIWSGDFLDPEDWRRQNRKRA